MMNNAAVAKAKANLDKDLSSLPPNNCVLFGENLFREFQARGWLTVEPFGLSGTTLFADKVPAYDKTHYAILTWDIPTDEYRVK